MKFESAPVMLGAATVEQNSLVMAAIVVAVALAVILGARREFAMFAVFAGVIGFIMVA